MWDIRTISLCSNYGFPTHSLPICVFTEQNLNIPKESHLDFQFDFFSKLLKLKTNSYSLEGQQGKQSSYLNSNPHPSYMYLWLLILGQTYTSSEILFFSSFSYSPHCNHWKGTCNTIPAMITYSVHSSKFRPQKDLLSKSCNLQWLSHWNTFFQSFFRDPMYFSIHFTVNDKTKTLWEHLVAT